MAKYAQQRGLLAIEIVIDAVGRRYRRGMVTPWAGVHAWVIRRIMDSDNVVEALVVKCDPVDVLEAWRESNIARAEDAPIKRPKRHHVRLSR
jgi:hypothetical protein